MICYVTGLLTAQNRSDYCKYLGGTLLEIYSQEDFTMLVQIIKRLIATNKILKWAWFAVGAEVVLDGNSSVLVWKNSRSLVDYSKYGMIKPAGLSAQVVRPNLLLFLQPKNYSASGFSFKLLAYLNPDIASQFICMKPGNIFSCLQ